MSADKCDLAWATVAVFMGGASQIVIYDKINDLVGHFVKRFRHWMKLDANLTGRHGLCTQSVESNPEQAWAQHEVAPPTMELSRTTQERGQAIANPCNIGGRKLADSAFHQTMIQGEKLEAHFRGRR